MRNLILRRSSSILLLAALMLLVFTATCLAMPNTLKITKANGNVVQYSINDAIFNADMMTAMNNDMAAAFEGGRAMVGLLSNGKVVDMQSALTSSGGYSSYESQISAGTISQAADLTANVDWQGNAITGQDDEFYVVTID